MTSSHKHQVTVRMGGAYGTERSSFYSTLTISNSWLLGFQVVSHNAFSCTLSAEKNHPPPEAGHGDGTAHPHSHRHRCSRQRQIKGWSSISRFFNCPPPPPPRKFHIIYSTFSLEKKNTCSKILYPPPRKFHTIYSTLPPPPPEKKYFMLKYPPPLRKFHSSMGGSRILTGI